MNKTNSLISDIVVFIVKLSVYNSISNLVTIPKKHVERKAWHALGDLVQSLLSQGNLLCIPFHEFIHLHLKFFQFYLPP